MEKSRDVIRRQHKSLATEKQYCGWIALYLRFCFTLPADMPSEKKFEAFLTYQAKVKDVAASTQNSAFHAVRFFYEQVLGKVLGKIDALRATRPDRLRTAPSIADTHKLLAAVPDVGGYPTNLIARLLYGRGLRVSEPLNLRMKDIRFDERKIFIIAGKGRKDRVVRLDDWMVEPLQRQMVAALLVWESDVRNGVPLEVPHQLARKYPETRFSKHWAWVFPSRTTCRHPRTDEIVRYRMHEANVQRAFKLARAKTGVLAVPHEMRHAHATHLLDTGLVNPKALQEEMGHKDIRTTFGYCHADALNVLDPTLISPRQTIIAVPTLHPHRLEYHHA